MKYTRLFLLFVLAPALFLTALAVEDPKSSLDRRIEIMPMIADTAIKFDGVEGEMKANIEDPNSTVDQRIEVIPMLVETDIKIDGVEGEMKANVSPKIGNIKGEAINNEVEGEAASVCDGATCGDGTCAPTAEACAGAEMPQAFIKFDGVQGESLEAKPSTNGDVYRIDLSMIEEDIKIDGIDGEMKASVSPKIGDIKGEAKEREAVCNGLDNDCDAEVESEISAGGGGGGGKIDDIDGELRESVYLKIGDIQGESQRTVNENAVCGEDNDCDDTTEVTPLGTSALNGEVNDCDDDETCAKPGQVDLSASGGVDDCNDEDDGCAVKGNGGGTHGGYHVTVLKAKNGADNDCEGDLAACASENMEIDRDEVVLLLANKMPKLNLMAEAEMKLEVDDKGTQSVTVETQEAKKIFGLFKVNMPVKVKIDVASGEADMNKPWYSFLAW
jgi:hypothetical protein